MRAGIFRPSPTEFAGESICPSFHGVPSQDRTIGNAISNLGGTLSDTVCPTAELLSYRA